jgi:hypothetical protein
LFTRSIVPASIASAIGGNGATAVEASLDTFFKHRERLLAESAVARVAIDKWYEARRQSEPELRELARLEGLLADRRRYLEQLMKLDDDMLNQLIAHRTRTVEGFN